MFASTHVFTAGPEFPPVPFVSRVSVIPLTETVVCALTVVVPAVDETSVIWQLPVPPAVVHGFGVVKLPGPLSIVKLIDVPFGALTNPPPLFTVTCAVKTCGEPTSFVAVAGVIAIRATTGENGCHAAATLAAAF